MKRILVPTDFSECADKAIKLALYLCKNTNTEIHILHSMDSHFTWMQTKLDVPKGFDPLIHSGKSYPMYPELEKLETAINKKLDALVKKAKKAGVKAKSVLVKDVTTHDIVSYASEESIDLIVMGTHGASGINEAFVGSNAQKVMRQATCPVITVRDLKSSYKLKSIVCFSDFVQDTAVKNIKKISAIAAFYKARIRFVYVNTPSYFEETEDTLDRIERTLKSAGIKNADVEIYNAFNIPSGVIQYSNKHKPDLIAISTHGNIGLKRWFTPNITESIVNHASVPVLSIHY